MGQSQSVAELKNLLNISVGLADGARHGDIVVMRGKAGELYEEFDKILKDRNFENVRIQIVAIRDAVFREIGVAVDGFISTNGEIVKLAVDAGRNEIANILRTRVANIDPEQIKLILDALNDAVGTARKPISSVIEIIFGALGQEGVSMAIAAIGTIFDVVVSLLRAQNANIADLLVKTIKDATLRLVENIKTQVPTLIEIHATTEAGAAKNAYAGAAEFYLQQPTRGRFRAPQK